MNEGKEITYCPQCGSGNNKTAEFCNMCGYALTASKVKREGLPSWVKVLLVIGVALILIPPVTVGAYYIWYKSFQNSSQSEIEERIGIMGGKLSVINVANDDQTFYISVKNATREVIGAGNGDISVKIKDSNGVDRIDVAAVETTTVGDIGGASITGATTTIPDGGEEQIEAHNTNYDIVTGETYTIIIIAAGAIETQRYTAV